MAVKIAEKIKLPVMVCFDGFITSHSIENIELLEDEKVKSFVGKYNPDVSLLKTNMSMGPLDLQAYYFEHRIEISEAMKNSKEIINEVSNEYYNLTNRKYNLFEEYMLDDAEYAILTLNSAAGLVKDVIDELRDKGLKVGLLKLRAFRPLPYKEIANSLKHLKSLAILDKADSINGYCRTSIF